MMGEQRVDGSEHTHIKHTHIKHTHTHIKHTHQTHTHTHVPGVEMSFFVVLLCSQHTHPQHTLSTLSTHTLLKHGGVFCFCSFSFSFLFLRLFPFLLSSIFLLFVLSLLAFFLFSFCFCGWLFFSLLFFCALNHALPFLFFFHFRFFPPFAFFGLVWCFPGWQRVCWCWCKKSQFGASGKLSTAIKVCAAPGQVISTLRKQRR